MNIFDEHPAKRVNGTPMLAAMRDTGKHIYAGTAAWKEVERRRKARKARRKTRQATR